MTARQRTRRARLVPPASGQESRLVREMRQLLALLDAAGTQAEWDTALARSVQHVVNIAAAGTGEKSDPQSPWVDVMAALSWRVGEGFRPPRNRPAHGIRAIFDAEIIRRELGDNASLAEAAALLRRYGGVRTDGLAVEVPADGEDPRPMTDAAMRKRVLRAEKAGGLRLRRDAPFGRKPR